MAVHNETSAPMNSSVSICEGFPYLKEEIQQEINNEFFTFCNIVFIVLNVFLSVLTMCTNAVVVRSIWKTPSLHSPSNLLLANLALADLGIGLLVQPSYIISKSFQLARSLQVVCTAGSIAESLFFVMTGASFFTLTCIAVNQFLVLHLHLRYNSLVNIEQTKKALVMVWIISFGIGLLRYNLNYIIVFCYVSIVVIGVFLLIASACYIKILRIISNHRQQIHLNLKVTSQVQEGISMPKYKRSVNTMLFIWVLYLFCYVPLLCLLLYGGIATSDSINYLPVIGTIVITITMAGSCLNPVVYCLRIAELRGVAIRTVRDMMHFRSGP